MYILFDIGGTKMRFAGSRDLRKITEPQIIDTPQDFHEAMEAIGVVVKRVSGREKIKAAAGGIPGEFNPEHTKLFYSPNLKSWLGKPIHKDLERVTGAPVYFENDAAMVGLGEAILGAGKGYSIVMYITVSTGVGGSRIVDGQIDEKSLGWEPGQQIISVEKTLPKVSNSQHTLEEYISGGAIERAYGMKPYEIKEPEVWEILAEQLAVGVHNSILLWSPDVVILGGSMITGMPRIDPARVSFYLKDMLPMYPEMPEIKEATLGDSGGLYGAMEYLKQSVVSRKLL